MKSNYIFVFAWSLLLLSYERFTIDEMHQILKTFMIIIL